MLSRGDTPTPAAIDPVPCSVLDSGQEGVDHRLNVAVGRRALAAFEVGDRRYTELGSLSQFLLVPGKKGASR